MNQAIALKQASMGSPGYNRDEVEKTFLKALNIENIEKIYPGVQATGPLPNPKLQIEQIKQEIAKAKLSAEERRWANEMLADRPKLMAEIDLLKAQAAKLIASIGAEQASVMIQAFEARVAALQYQIDRGDRQLDSMQKVKRR